MRAAKPSVGAVESPLGRRGAAPVAPTGSSGAPATIRGRIEIAPQLAEDVRPGSVLFLIARSGASSAGPPLAVRRFATPHFPLEFEIGQENVMIPSMRFEGAISLSARLDADGNAMTRGSGDISSQVEEPLAPGATGVKLFLTERG